MTSGLPQDEPRTPSPAPESEEPPLEARRLRFKLTVQKSRACVYTLAVAVGLLDRALGGFPMNYTAAALFLAVANLSALAFHELYRRGLDRRLGVELDHYWLACDVGLITLAVYLGGGQSHYFFIWYLANVAAAAFVGGIGTALVVALADVGAYVGVMAVLGHVTGFDATLLQPVTRMAFLFGAAFFLLRDISGLREERRLLKRVHREQSREIEELTLLSQELRRRADELSAANALLADTAATDPLTGLRNRRFLDAQLPLDVETVKRAYGDALRGGALRPRNSDLGFVLLDLDHFKRINDVHGHDAGDTVLRRTSETLKGCLRTNDVLIRWGGEEFLFLLRHTNGDFLPVIAQRLLRAVARQRIELPGGGEPRVTTSIGWSFYPMFGGTRLDQSWEDVLEIADRALYLAKRNGRNMAVGLVGAEDPALSADVREVCSDIRRAVESGRLGLVSTREVSDLG